MVTAYDPNELVHSLAGMGMPRQLIARDLMARGFTVEQINNAFNTFDGNMQASLGVSFVTRTSTNRSEVSVVLVMCAVFVFIFIGGAITTVVAIDSASQAPQEDFSSLGTEVTSSAAATTTAAGMTTDGTLRQ